MKRERFVHSALTDVGMARSVNQDNFVVKVCSLSFGQVGVFAVVDGMGGLAEGEYAALIAKNKIEAWADEDLPLLFVRKIYSNENLKAHAEKLLTDISDTIRVYAAAKGIQAGIAISLLIIFKSYYYVFHAGDTRVYQLSKNKIKQITVDETWVAEQVRAGLLTQAEADVHEKRHMLVNCLGVFEETQTLSFKGKVKNKDTFFLCSDGLYNMVASEELPNFSVENLINLSNERGGYDNITLIAVKIK